MTNPVLQPHAKLPVRHPADDDDDATTIVMNAPRDPEPNDTVLQAPGDFADLEHFAAIDPQQQPGTAPAIHRRRLLLLGAVVVAVLVVTTTIAARRAHRRNVHVTLPAEIFRPPPPKPHPATVFASPVRTTAIGAPAVSDPIGPVPTPTMRTTAVPHPSVTSTFGLPDHQSRSSPRRFRRPQFDDRGILIPST